MKQQAGRRRQGCTLIELIVVVAIIAILATIAIPNFLEAQTRAKVSRVKADIRALSTAMEAYAADNNAYPYCNPAADHAYLTDISVLTTPIAYMTSLPQDVFMNTEAEQRKRYYRYYPIAYWRLFYPSLQLQEWRWIVMSNGPNLRPDISRENAEDAIAGDFWMLYDPSNGTVSPGDIWATNVAMKGGGMN